MNHDNFIEVHILPDGTFQMMYSDEAGLPVDDTDIVHIGRASLVEFEDVGGRRGWTVRSAKDPTLALRVDFGGQWAASRSGDIVTFHSRNTAVEEERKFFWDLLNAKETNHGDAE